MNGRLRPISVVIADDSAAIRERLVRLLSEVPGVVVLAETVDVPATLEALQLLRPAVLILDLSMPGGSGLEVLRQMRRAKLECVVIVLTNYDFPEYARRVRAYGAWAFLNKSTQFMKVIELVRDLTLPRDRRRRRSKKRKR